MTQVARASSSRRLTIALPAISGDWPEALRWVKRFSRIDVHKVDKVSRRRASIGLAAAAGFGAKRQLLTAGGKASPTAVIASRPRSGRADGAAGAAPGVPRALQL